MNSKIKKFYYTTHKSNESKYIHFLFRNMVLLIEACKINDIIYIFVIFLNLIQSISISLELSNELKTHSKIKKYSRFFHFCNFLTKEYFSEESFKAFNILNLIIIILPIFLFYFISYKKPKKLINITIYVLSYLFFIDKYILLTYNFCIIFSPYIIKNNNYKEDHSSDINCYCNKIEELILNKKLDLRDASQINLDNDNEIDLEIESLIINDKDIIDDSYSDTKLEKQEKHIKVWGYLIENIIEKAINISISNKSQDYIRIDFANFLSYYLGKYVRSLIEISYVNKNTLPFYFQFYMYDCKNKLLEVNKTKELFEKESDKNFFKILEYNRNYEKFLKIIKDTSELSVNFWSEMEKNVFQPKIFEKRGFEICKSTTKLEKYSKLILTNNPYDIRTLKIYGTFLNHVLKLSDESKIYIDKAFLQLIMSVDEIEKNNNNLNNDSMKNFFQNQIDSSIIVVNGNKENIGRVKYVNYDFTNIFGF